MVNAGCLESSFVRLDSTPEYGQNARFSLKIRNDSYINAYDTHQSRHHDTRGGINTTTPSPSYTTPSSASSMTNSAKHSPPGIPHSVAERASSSAWMPNRNCRPSSHHINKFAHREQEIERARNYYQRRKQLRNEHHSDSTDQDWTVGSRKVPTWETPNITLWWPWR